MAKHITKSVIEDIAYEIKRIGLITQAYEQNTQTEEMVGHFGAEIDTSGTETLEWVIESLEGVFHEHDPTFDVDRYRKQAAFKVEM